MPFRFRFAFFGRLAAALACGETRLFIAADALVRVEAFENKFTRSRAHGIGLVRRVHLQPIAANFVSARSQVGAAGHPTLTLATHEAADLGRIFFLAEFAVAVAGWALEINPFDQPNVQEAKDNSKRVLESGSIPSFVSPYGAPSPRMLIAEFRGLVE